MSVTWSDIERLSIEFDGKPDDVWASQMLDSMVTFRLSFAISDLDSLAEICLRYAHDPSTRSCRINFWLADGSKLSSSFEVEAGFGVSTVIYPEGV